MQTVSTLSALFTASVRLATKGMGSFVQVLSNCCSLFLVNYEIISLGNEGEKDRKSKHSCCNTLPKFNMIKNQNARDQKVQTRVIKFDILCIQFVLLSGRPI